MIAAVDFKVSGRAARGQLALAALALCIAPLSRVPLAAQQCHAAVRELVNQSALARFRDIGSPGADAHDMIADGTQCARDSATDIQRSIPIPRGTLRTGLERPAVRADFLGGLPDARGAGTMWSGRGATLWVRGGVSLDAYILHAVLAPSLWWTQNKPFVSIPFGNDAVRNDFSSPFYTGDYSIDTPTRFGADGFSTIEPGETSIWATLRGFDAGVSTSTQSWGPGLRTHLLLGPDAPGIPRVFARTATPVATRAGALSAQVFAGRLRESRFFDNNGDNDIRYLVAWTAAISPKPAPNLSLSVSHAILFARPRHGTSGEQMLTAAARLRAPTDRWRAWLELGRDHPLPSLSEFLRVPNEGLAYVAGLEGVAFTAGATSFLVTAETANLEQPLDVREQAPRDFYVSRAIAQGWTQHGRFLGASTGPGSQSQWLAFDGVRPRWSAGVYAERVRWNEDAFLRLAFPAALRHDVTVGAGVRAAYVYRGYEIGARLGSGKRMNYLFQNGTYIPGYRTVDIALPQLRLSVTPVQ